MTLKSLHLIYEIDQLSTLFELAFNGGLIITEQAIIEANRFLAANHQNHGVWIKFSTITLHLDKVDNYDS